MIKDSKGVTMIILVIMIIVMIILASVTVYTAVNLEIIDNTKEITSSAEFTNVKENIKMDILAEKNKHGSNQIKQSNIDKILKRYIDSDEQLLTENMMQDGIEKEIIVGIKLRRR